MDSAQKFMTLALPLCLTLTIGVPPSPASAETYFEGKSISVYSGSAPGGGYDSYARLVARFIGQHLPGKPQTVIRNMPGGGGLVLANFLYARGTRDGLSIGGVSKSIPFETYLGNDAAKYDPMKFTWLGTSSTYADDAYVIAVRSDSKLNSIADLRKVGKPVFFGGTSSAQSSNDVILIAKEAFKLNLDLIRGYAGTNDVSLALRRSEVQGFATGMSAIRTSFGDMLSRGELTMLVQFGHEQRWSRLPHVPTAMELVKSDEARSLIELLEIPLRIARPFVAPPDVPSDAAAALKKAFMSAHRDAEFLELAQKQQLDISPLGGDEILETILRFSRIDKTLIERYKEIVK